MTLPAKRAIKVSTRCKPEQTVSGMRILCISQLKFITRNLRVLYYIFNVNQSTINKQKRKK